MSRIKGSDTKPEILVRSILHRNGFRFRKNDRKLPGKPDIVLPKCRTVIFVHGCFWHRHPNCNKAYTPKSRIEFWQKKFNENVCRDRRNAEELKKLGWNVEIIWQCETDDREKFDVRLREIAAELRRNMHP